MNIYSSTTSLPKAPGAGLPVRGHPTEHQSRPQTIAANNKSEGSPGVRPVRLNRAPEEAAVFAYNRLAEYSPSKTKAHIDEYV